MTRQKALPQEYFDGYRHGVIDATRELHRDKLPERPDETNKVTSKGKTPRQNTKSQQ
ncbi:MAG: hypothetical protein HN348_13240 [Proteobacteria bacterium]|jgi:hypothetical protein|nr:hypothetical protein [Pseudomonadota bacterium]